MNENYPENYGISYLDVILFWILFAACIIFCYALTGSAI